MAPVLRLAPPMTITLWIHEYEVWCAIYASSDLAMLIHMAGPTVRRVQIGSALRRLREAAGMSVAQVAEVLKTSKQRISAIELGRNTLQYAELKEIVIGHYNGTPAQLEALEEIRQEAMQRGWWSTYGLPEWLASYVGLEHGASSVRTIELELVPGLLQTEEYARQLYVRSGRLSAKQVEQRTAARMKRQERLACADPMRLTAVLSEGALLRCAYEEKSISAGQLAKLLDRAEWPNIELLVIPYRHGLHACAAGAFSLLSFPSGVLPDSAHQEYAVGGHIVDDDSVVSELARLFDKLRVQALPSKDSLEMIAELAQHIGD